MVFKDYEELDVTRETATREELEKLKKKYGENKEYVVDIREVVLSIGLSFILSVAIIILYGNIIKFSIDFILGIFISYFSILSIVVLSIYLSIQKIDTKWYVSIALLGLDALILMSSLLIANMVPISSTLQTIMPIIGITALVLFLPLVYMVVKFEPRK